MRVVIALGVGCLCAAAQVPPPAPAEEPPLRNTGKPMIVAYRCSDEDIQLAGMSCSAEDPCPVYLELSAVEAVGNRIFLAGNIHSATTTLYSVLLASDDAGKTWREPYERIRAAGLDHIQFVDFENGWISGAVLHPLPRDPFLLITSDGGKAWRSHPIFAEPRFGSIVEFWFSSRTDGGLLIDRGEAEQSGRYEFYNSPNAGETWMLREVNERPIQIKHAGGLPNADWRIRADAASKSFHIERHAADRWQSVAGFSVSLGVCKPPEVTAPPAEAPVPGTGAYGHGPG